jgi:hypothetical protein
MSNCPARTRTCTGMAAARPEDSKCAAREQLAMRVLQRCAAGSPRRDHCCDVAASHAPWRGFEAAGCMTAYRWLSLHGVLERRSARLRWLCSCSWRPQRGRTAARGKRTPRRRRISWPRRRGGCGRCAPRACPRSARCPAPGTVSHGSVSGGRTGILWPVCGLLHSLVPRQRLSEHAHYHTRFSKRLRAVFWRIGVPPVVARRQLTLLASCGVET